MNAEIFHQCLAQIPFDDEARSYLKEIIRNLPADLAPDGGGHYSKSTFHKLIKDAGDRLANLLSDCRTPVTYADLRDAWHVVMVDYHRQGNWGYPTQIEKPQKELTEDQKTARELWPYIWVLIQSSLLLKTVIMYFGIHASSEPTTQNTLFLAAALLTSAGTLIFFAWRKSRK